MRAGSEVHDRLAGWNGEGEGGCMENEGGSGMEMCSVAKNWTWMDLWSSRKIVEDIESGVLMG